MKTIVYYYSRKGSNRFLATRIANDLKCEIEEIKPRLNAHLLMIMGLNLGNRKLKSNIENYDRVILCGPIYMGRLIIPLKNLINKHSKKLRKLVFVTCCGSSFKDKDNKYGHNLVFNQVKSLLKDKCLHCEAFPVDVFAPAELKEDSAAFMKVHMNSENFKGKIFEIYEAFIERITNE
ncbi:MAG: flavodoxin domain-containing protein [Bacteroidales bacterium]